MTEPGITWLKKTGSHLPEKSADHTAVPAAGLRLTAPAAPCSLQLRPASRAACLAACLAAAMGMALIKALAAACCHNISGKTISCPGAVYLHLT